VGTTPSTARVPVALGTQHRKGPLLAPTLATVGLEVVEVAIDTDRFGTFSGTRARTGTAVEVARAKALAAMAASGLPRGLGSEGSFGPNPILPTGTVDEELLVYVDQVAGLEVHGVAQAPAFAVEVEIEVAAPPPGLAELLRLGTHAAFCSAMPASAGPVAEVGSAAELERVLAQLRSSGSARARLRTDLRAHRCPSRQVVLRAAAEDLRRRLAARCPVCDRPDALGPRAVCCRSCSMVVATVLDAVACGHCGLVVAATPELVDPDCCPACSP